jgi:hypothetical protein
VYETYTRRASVPGQATHAQLVANQQSAATLLKQPLVATSEHLALMFSPVDVHVFWDTGNWTADSGRLAVHFGGGVRRSRGLLAAAASAILIASTRLRCPRSQNQASLLCCVAAVRLEAIALQVLLGRRRRQHAESSQLLCELVVRGLHGSCVS